MSTLKVTTVLSADTPTVNITDGLNVTGVSTVANITATTLTSTNIVNSTQLSHRNIVINGAMRVAQRATTYTGADNYNSVDRFKVIHSGLNEDVTSAQVDVSGSETDSPLLKGITKAWRITNGNQTDGAGTGDLLSIQYRIEAQDLRNSGWIYTSTSSFVTLSFYVKSSVAQSFGGFLRSHDGTQMTFPFETGALTANTWKKITITLPGNASLQFDDDTNCGMEINISQFWGTDYTTSGKTLDAWSAYDNAARLKDFPASTWYTTNDATFELTGVQFELGSVATPFEHRSFGDELARCQRYYYRHATGNTAGISENATQYNGSSVFLSIPLPTEMRAAPTLEITNSSNHFLKYANNGPVLFDTLGRDGITTPRLLCVNGSASGTSGHACMIRTNSSDAKIAAVAEI